MQQDFREKEQRSFANLKMIYNISMGVLILAMAGVMFFAEKLNLSQIANADADFRYLFGVLCLLYGGFRFYRGMKKEI
jgi:hypothetical protein